MTEYDDRGNKILSSGPEGFMVIDFSRYHDGWTNVTSDADDHADLEETVRSLPKTANAIPAEWRDKAFDLEVAKRKRQIRVDNEARREVESEEKDPFEEPDVVDLATFLGQPDNPTLYRIDQLWPINGNVLFAAAAKFGKSTMVMNLIRSMSDGTSFLGHFECPRVAEGETILLIDLEMSPDRVRSELRGQNIQNLSQLRLANLRGQAKLFDVTDPEVRAYWVAYCQQHNVKTLILDPLAPLLGYLNVEENDNTTVNRFFQQLDEFKMECGIRDMLVTHHCGHTADWRPRGASRFNDWPDALWLAKIDGDITDPATPRKFFVRGRDVGEEFQSAAVIQRDLNNQKVLLIDMQSAAVSASAQSLRGIVENLVFTHQGKDRGFLLPLIQAQVPNDPPSDRKLLDVLREMTDEGLLHAHTIPGAVGRPALHYWMPDSCPCQP